MREYQKLRQYVLEKWLIDLEEVNREIPRPYLKGAAAVVLHRMYAYKTAQIGPWLGVHRTTINHYLNEHEAKYKYHPGYGDYFDAMWRYMLDQPDVVLDITELKKSISNALPA